MMFVAYVILLTMFVAYVSPFYVLGVNLANFHECQNFIVHFTPFYGTQDLKLVLLRIKVICNCILRKKKVHKIIHFHELVKNLTSCIYTVAEKMNRVLFEKFTLVYFASEKITTHSIYQEPLEDTNDYNLEF